MSLGVQVDDIVVSQPVKKTCCHLRVAQLLFLQSSRRISAATRITSLLLMFRKEKAEAVL